MKAKALVLCMNSQNLVLVINQPVGGDILFVQLTLLPDNLQAGILTASKEKFNYNLQKD